MKSPCKFIFVPLSLAVLLSGCGLLPGSAPAFTGPTPIPVASPTPSLAAETLFVVQPPEGTAAEADLSLVLVDEVTGLPYNTQVIPMQRLDDGRWQARLTPPVGSLLRYHYVRRAPTAADEVNALGEPIRYRLALISGPSQVDDIVAAWADAPSHGPTGRIVGRVRDTQTGKPLPEIAVNAAGVAAYTDGEGSFRLDGLPPGQHRLTLFAADGAYQPVQQGALIAADSATPVELSLTPARPIQVSFEVTVPSDTDEAATLRMAGNLRQLGQVFADLPGGTTTSVGRMPALVRVDPTHYLLITSLYAGTDLRYKYSLGDGLWNAERDSKGYFLTRQVILPDQDLTLQDTVSTWQTPGQGSISFQVTVPASTPPNDEVSLQLNPFAWFDALPMWKASANVWRYTLHGPLDFQGDLNYRYCRNQRCGAADDADTPGTSASPRQVKPGSQAQSIQDAVRAWQWLEGDLPATNVVAPPITPRTGFEAGFELLPDYRPSWSSFLPASLSDLAGPGANAVTFSPAWTLLRNNPVPAIGLDPASGPFRDELSAWVGEAHKDGLRVTFRPTLRVTTGTVEAWWASGSRDGPWWTVWFEGYRSFILTYARLASETGVETLVLGGPEITPALPGGVIGGASAGTPADAEARWRALLSDVRAVYAGKIAFEIELAQSLQPPPAFLDAVDEIRVYWHAPLAAGASAGMDAMQSAAASLLDKTVLPAANGKPVVLSVEYLSVAGGGAACAKAPDLSCRQDAEFDGGAIVDPELPVDLSIQAQAINAMLLEAYSHSGVTGFFVRRYDPTVALRDKSASVNGKPARDVLWYCYQRMVAR